MRPSSPVPKSPSGASHDAEIHGIDALEIPLEAHPSRGSRLWSATWPVVAAIVLFLVFWQIVVWLELRPSYALPGPVPVFEDMWADRALLLKGFGITMTRAAIGYAVAFLVGTLLGLAVSGSKPLRAAVGSLITGLQTMPSIAWFPLAILLFGLTENAILFVIVLGAAPAIANGLIVAIDHIPPLLLSAGRVLGARGIAKYRHVILPAAFPSFVGGMKQGWAFAWRSLMAGELLVGIAHRLGLGTIMHNDQVVSDAVGLIGTMIVILVIGIVVDRLLFARMERSVRVRWGLTGESV
jgi:NitT/TauT family transport system permease protein